MQSAMAANEALLAQAASSEVQRSQDAFQLQRQLRALEREEKLDDELGKELDRQDEGRRALGIEHNRSLDPALFPVATESSNATSRSIPSRPGGQAGGSSPLSQGRHHQADASNTTSRDPIARFSNWINNWGRVTRPPREECAQCNAYVQDSLTNRPDTNDENFQYEQCRPPKTNVVRPDQRIRGRRHRLRLIDKTQFAGPWHDVFMKRRRDPMLPLKSIVNLVLRNEIQVENVFPRNCIG